MLDTMAQRLARDFNRRRAFAMRSDGASFPEIGRRLGVGPRSAAMLTAEGRLRAAAMDYLDALLRAQNDNRLQAAERQAR